MLTEPTAAELIAARLRERYTLERELGRGGMARVYLARDLRHDRLVALKLLRAELSAPLGTARFQREVRLTAHLQHPGILPLFDSGEAAGQLWYTMPYVAGGTLRDRLRRMGPMPVTEAVGLVRQIAAPLDYAHGQGVVHRDLKPENILLGASGPVIADFGIARALALVGEERLTETGLALGTPEYMSPEQVMAGRRVDGRSDVYALGCVLYELLAGEPPYTGVNPQTVIAKRLTAPIPRVTVVRPEVSVAIEQVLTRALARAPADRYPTAAAFGVALERAVEQGREAGGLAWPQAWRRLFAGGVARVRLPPQRPARRQVVLSLVLAAGLVVAPLAATRLWRSSGNPAASTLDPNVVAVLPFQVTAPDSTSNYLREGAVDLLNARLTGDGVPRAVDSRTTLARWRRAGEGRELSTAQALEVARGLGAGQLLIGELIRTPVQATVRGRVLRVADGGLVAEHSETARPGELDELGLIDRWMGRVFTVPVGEGAARLPHLSDSAAAVKAFLAGRQAHRRGEHAAAAKLYRQAFEIDTAFALAMYWLTYVSVFTSGVDEIRSSRQTAWALRDRLSERDRAQLEAEMAGPPGVPDRSLVTGLGAVERAADLNPDRPEALERLGAFYLDAGAEASIDGWAERAAIALDSAIRLDSGFAAAVETRARVALMTGDREGVRRYGTHYLDRFPRGEWRQAIRWLVAAALEDSAALSALGPDLPESTVGSMIALSTQAGFSLQALDRPRPAHSSELATAGPEARCEFLYNRMHIAMVRGRVAAAIALVDSLNTMASTCGGRRIFIRVSLADPGYERAVERSARQIIPYADTTTQDFDAICHAELWHVSRGDTISTRRSIRRLRPAPAPEVGSPGFNEPALCPLLLEAALESSRPETAARGRLQALEDHLHQGVGLAMLGPLANLLVARWHEARGDPHAALRAVRRRIGNFNVNHTTFLPALLKEEGRLSALTGDTTGAIRAYQRYLRVRDAPDPGPMQDQVSRVKAHLAEILGEPGAP